MCGIIAAIVNQKAKQKIDANEFIINQFEDQHSRGKEGFGLIRINKNIVEAIDRATTPMKFLMDLYNEQSESLIAHHRQPTSTDNKMAQTHPIIVSNKELKFNYFIVHNGVIINDDDLKEEHEKAGYTYTTEYAEEKWSGYQVYKKETKFNDSETMAIDLARYIEGKQSELLIHGTSAFIAIQCKKSNNQITKIFFGRRSNPLKCQLKKGFLLLSSEGPGELIDPLVLYWIDITKDKNKQRFTIHNKDLLFEDERTNKEKKEKEELEKALKEKDKEYISPDHSNTITETKNDTLNLPPKKEEPEETIKISGREMYFQEVQDDREQFEGDLDALDKTYWEIAKEGTNRSLKAIEHDFEECLEARKDVIFNAIEAYCKVMCEPGFDKNDEKVRRNMTMMIISKAISSMETIAGYETYNIEKLEEKTQEEIEAGTTEDPELYNFITNKPKTQEEMEYDQEYWDGQRNCYGHRGNGVYCE